LLDYHPSFSELYKDMPVVRLKDCKSKALSTLGPLVDYCQTPAARDIKDWADVTPEWLEGEWRRLRASSLDVQKLFWPYWFHRLYEDAG